MTTNKLEVSPWCGCVLPLHHSYCQVHDASLTCPIEDCDLVFPHEPDGPEHAPACGCWYWNGGAFGLCAEHEAMASAGPDEGVDRDVAAAMDEA